MLEERRLPLRHGADHPDRAARAAAHLRRGRPRPGATSSTSSGSTRSGAASSTTARASTCMRGRRRHGRPRWTRFAPGTARTRATAGSSTCRSGCTSISERFFFWKPVEDMFDTIDIKANFNPATLRDVLALRMGSTVAGTVRGQGQGRAASPRCSTTSRSMSAPRPTARRRCSAASPTCRRPRASGTRWAAPAPWPRRWPSSPASWARAAARRRR